MKIWSFYNEKTGEFSPKKFGGPPHALARNQRPGYVAIEGDFDHLSCRFDLESGQVVDYQPPAPSADHEWNADTRRWVLRQDVRARQAARQRVLAEISRLETSQLRPLREVMSNDPDVRAAAEARIKDIDNAIKELRSRLR